MKTNLVVRARGALCHLNGRRIVTSWISRVALVALFAFSAQAAYLRNVPRTIVQPDGDTVRCFASGDEFHQWLHDRDNFTIVQDPQTGYYVYAVAEKGNLIPSPNIVGKVDPANTKLTKGVNLSPQKITEKRNAILGVRSHESLLAPKKGQIHQPVIFVRFSDDPEFAGGIQLYDSLFNAQSSSAESEYNYFRVVSYQQLSVSSFFYPQPSGSAIVSYQDRYPRGYYLPYNSITNPLGYTGDPSGQARWNREDSLLGRAIDAISSQVPSDLNLDGDNNNFVDNVCFIVYGRNSDWGTLLWGHASKLAGDTRFRTER